MADAFQVANSNIYACSSRDLELLGGLGDGTVLSAGNESLNLGLVGGVGDESGDLALEAFF